MLQTIFTLRYALITWPAILIAVSAGLMAVFPAQDWWLLPFAGLCLASVLIGIHDLRQTRHAVLRNYPVAAHLRFLLESIRPEMRQYFFEGDKDGTPFPRDKRAIVYQRAKRDLDKRPFGTQFDVYQEQYEWLHHSIAPQKVQPHEALRTLIGAGTAKPYSASLLNISAMSYGSLSANAIRALNKGAKAGGFFHDTGEGGVSPYHRENGGDLVWELGSGYFGARTADGGFDPVKFADAATDPQIRMVELKLSQGAKPGHGGVLPAAKVTAEISRIRGVPMGQDCNSPAHHAAFSTPIGLLEFVARMRDLSGGKPAGFKLCIGHPWEFMAICKAMIQTGITPDFIVVDGKEGGTGAAPLEFMDYVGMPLRDGLSFVHNAWSASGSATRCGSAQAARSPRPSTSPARWPWGPTGATPRAASCSRSAAFRRKAATPANARPGSRRKTPCANAPSSSPTRRNGWQASIATRCTPLPNLSPRRAFPIPPS